MPELKELPDPNIKEFKEIGELLDTEVKEHDLFSSRTIAGPTDLFSGIPPSKPGDPTFAEMAFTLRQEEGTEEEFCTHCGKKFTPENRLANYAENPETGKRGPACQECMNIKKELAPFFIK